MKKYLLFSPTYLLLLFCLSTSPAFAQQTTPDTTQVPRADSLLLEPADSLVLKGFVLVDTLNYRFIGDGNFTRGNVNRSLMVLRAEILATGPVISIATNPRFTYGKQNNILAERDTYVDLFIDVFKKRRTYVFGLGTLETSNLRGISLRQLAGAGIGYRLLKTDKNIITLTNAIIHESTDFRERSSVVTQRNSLRVKGKHLFLQDKIRINHVTFLQPALTDLSNLRWNTLVSLELPLNRWITLRTSFENSYESIVEPGRLRNDTRITFGVSVGNRQ